jgi:hypothetical protein
LGVQLAGDATLAVVVLLAATALSVYKPWGRTRYGQRIQQERHTVPQRATAISGNRINRDGPSPRLKAAFIVIGVILAVLGFLLARPAVVSLFLH